MWPIYLIATGIGTIWFYKRKQHDKDMRKSTHKETSVFQRGQEGLQEMKDKQRKG